MSDKKKIINLGILAHVDAGKTTVTENLLYFCGKTRSPGSVDSGNTVTDSSEIEKKRGISVFSSGADIQYGDFTVNIIDTPGHVDFAGEAERSIMSLDAALIVVSAVEGLQSHTENIMQTIIHNKLPCVFFVNKIDRAGSSFKRVVNELSEAFGKRFVCLNVPVGEESKGCSVAPNEDFRTEASEVLAEYNDSIMEKYLSDEEISDIELQSVLSNECAKGEVYPVVCGSAMYGIGIGELLDAVVKNLPDSTKIGTDKLSGVIYKIEHDKTFGVLSHVRMFGGSLNARDTVVLKSPKDDAPSNDGEEREERSEKIAQIRKKVGGKFFDTGTVEKGDIAVLCGLSKAKVGDYIGEITAERRLDLVNPFLQVSVIPEDETKLTALASALAELSREEPYINYRWEKSEREVVISITGKIQLEIIANLLLERYGLKVTFTPPSVIYKETPGMRAEGFEAYTMPKPCWAVVQLLLEPTKRGSGVSFDMGNVPNNQLFYRYQSHIKQSFFTSIEQGIYGWEVTDFKCTLIGGEHHTIHTHPLDFFVATPVAFLRGLTNSRSRLLEPYLKVRIGAPEEYMGKITGDIVMMRGEFDTPVIKNGKTTIEAFLPVADSMDYPTRLASLTGGKGMIHSAFGFYRECPDGFMKTCKRRGVDPLDRAKWILHCRGAITEGI
ncbi:MAG: TetM/TetW/TetO/TetS family tetracycline resistance ribosomal protection protein [Clostridia bacterium]|nr:TetM/TetW/TetO/TetS family tetracycline resistance ribosomal protection protein [Clostridia bacterium]